MSPPFLSAIPWMVVMLSPDPATAPLDPGVRRPERISTELPVEGAMPLAGEQPTSAAPHPILAPDGTEPLAEWSQPAQSRRGPPPVIAKPLRDTPIVPVRPPDPRTTRILRLDLVSGPLFRVREIDPTLMASGELGAMHGFSGSFHTAMIIAMQNDRQFVGNVVRAFDFPIGFGAVARGRLRNRPLYGSIGLTAGILVHRAKIEEAGAAARVMRQVDPDFRLPIRFAWTIKGIGISLALEQGYSVRARSYSRRGAELWARSAYRIGFTLGLHWDIMAGRTALSQSRRRVRSRS